MIIFIPPTWKGFTPNLNICVVHFTGQGDLKERKRVVFLGSVIATRLFGNPEPIGEMLKIDGIPFKVVGIMPKKLQTSMNNGPDDRRAIIPYTTFQAIYGDKYLDEMIKTSQI